MALSRGRQMGHKYSKGTETGRSIGTGEMSGQRQGNAAVAAPPAGWVRGKNNHLDVAALFVSVEARMDIAVTHLKSSALDYLFKPVSKAELVQSVNDAREKQDHYLENYDQQEHREELLLHQSKALENKAREVKALNRMFAKMPMLGVKSEANGIATDEESEPPGTN